MIEYRRSGETGGAESLSLILRSETQKRLRRAATLSPGGRTGAVT